MELTQETFHFADLIQEMKLAVVNFQSNFDYKIQIVATQTGVTSLSTVELHPSNVAEQKSYLTYLWTVFSVVSL